MHTYNRLLHTHRHTTKGGRDGYGSSCNQQGKDSLQELDRSIDVRPNCVTAPQSAAFAVRVYICYSRACVYVCLTVVHISFPRSKLGSNQLVLSRQFAVRPLRVCLLCTFFLWIFAMCTCVCVNDVFVCECQCVSTACVCVCVTQ